MKNTTTSNIAGETRPVNPTIVWRGGMAALVFFVDASSLWTFDTFNPSEVYGEWQGQIEFGIVNSYPTRAAAETAAFDYLDARIGKAVPA